MKKTIAILFVFVMPFSVLLAQELPKWAENARKAVFSIVTYTKDGQILSTGNGFYIDEQGTGVSDYSLFKGAERAIIITANGKELPVKYMMGANDMYDVVKFKTDFDKKAEALQPATLPSSTGETVYLVPYSTQKSSKGQTGTIAKVDTIGEQQYYYTLTMQTTEKTVSCPIMNAAGQVVGMIQKNNDPESKESFAIGIRYLTDLTINALSVNDLALNSIGIKKGLPEDESQALVYLYMASGVYAPNQYFDLLNDFISQYPNNMEGYLRRATYYINIGDDTHYALAVEDLKKMLDVSEKKDEAHYNIAKLIYSYQLNIGDKKPYASWTFDYALNEINEALAITQEPARRHLFCHAKIYRSLYCLRQGEQEQTGFSRNFLFCSKSQGTDRRNRQERSHSPDGQRHCFLSQTLRKRCSPLPVRTRPYQIGHGRLSGCRNRL